MPHQYDCPDCEETFSEDTVDAGRTTEEAAGCQRT